jgi:hypothetical protein
MQHELPLLLAGLAGGWGSIQYQLLDYLLLLQRMRGVAAAAAAAAEEQQDQWQQQGGVSVEGGQSSVHSTKQPLTSFV